MNNLIINGIDHSVFDLEWAKRGGWCIVRGEVCKFIPKASYISYDTDILFIRTIAERMATPKECANAGVEYIEPPARWLPIESAPEDGRIIEVADFRVVVANECPLSKHWKFWRDIPHPLNKNSMTQPPKDE